MKKGRLSFAIASLFSLVAGACATYFTIGSGLLPIPWDTNGAAGTTEQWTAELSGASFVPVPPLVISLGPDAAARHLRVVLHLDVAPGSEAAVVAAEPRVLDVLNMFLRAVDERDFELPAAMSRLRAQMLRRVQLVTPSGAVRDVLIQEFVLN